MVELPDDAIEALVQAAEHAYEYTPYDEIAEHAWPNVVRAVYPLIAARVRAEALREAAEKIAPNQVRPSNVIVVGARMTDDVLDVVRTVEDALVAAVRAEAVAGERQRIALAVDRLLRNPPRGSVEELYPALMAAIRATGSVPVAARLQPGRVGFGSDAFEVGGSLPGHPVATPTEPAACSCDGAVYHSAEENARRQPFIVNPACPVHGARSAAEWTASALAGSGLPAGQWAEIVAASPVPAEQPTTCEHGRTVAHYYGDDGDPGDYRYCDLGAGFRPVEQPAGDGEAFDRRAGEEAAGAELLGHRLTVGEAMSEAATDLAEALRRLGGSFTSGAGWLAAPPSLSNLTVAQMCDVLRLAIGGEMEADPQLCLSNLFLLSSNEIRRLRERAENAERGGADARAAVGRVQRLVRGRRPRRTLPLSDVVTALEGSALPWYERGDAAESRSVPTGQPEER